MNQTEPRCLVCEQTDQQIPLLTLTYQGKNYHVCPTHFPILIHQPEKLVGKLPGAEKLVPHNHDD
jgi:hypothetical protein